MYKGVEKKQIEVGNLCVPFCKDCNSQNIVQVCKDCGSHNVSTDFLDDRSNKPNIKEYTAHIYICDKCGKEFDGLKVDGNISYCDGEFMPYKMGDEYGEPLVYSVPKDLCEDCKQKLTDKLNLKLEKIYNVYSVKQDIEKFMEG